MDTNDGMFLVFVDNEVVSLRRQSREKSAAWTHLTTFCLSENKDVKSEVLPVFVDESVEGHPVPPAGGEVVDVDVGISGEEEECQW